MLITILGFPKNRLPRFGRARQSDIGAWKGCARGGASGEIGTPLVGPAASQAAGTAACAIELGVTTTFSCSHPFLFAAKMPGGFAEYHKVNGRAVASCYPKE